MKLSLFACLAVCLAVALANPIGDMTAPTAAQTVMIDVTSDFVDNQRNQHIFQVAVGVQVVRGEVMLNGFRVAHGIQTTVQFSAEFREVEFGTNKVVNAHNVNVGVQAVIQEQLSAKGTLTGLSVQLLLSEVDGNLLSQIEVHEVIVFLNMAGAETSRKVNTLPLVKSLITTTTTTTEASTADATSDSTGAPSSTGEPTSTDDTSDSSSDEKDQEEHYRMEKCRVRRFFNWVHKQSFGVRVLIYAIMAVIFVLLCKFVFCLISVCCCSKPRSRTTYLNNVELHYVPLSLDEDDKKPLLI